MSIVIGSKVNLYAQINQFNPKIHSSDWFSLVYRIHDKLLVYRIYTKLKIHCSDWFSLVYRIHNKLLVYHIYAKLKIFE